MNTKRSYLRVERLNWPLRFWLDSNWQFWFMGSAPLFLNDDPLSCRDWWPYSPWFLSPIISDSISIQVNNPTAKLGGGIIWQFRNTDSWSQQRISSNRKESPSCVCICSSYTIDRLLFSFFFCHLKLSSTYTASLLTALYNILLKLGD